MRTNRILAPLALAALLALPTLAAAPPPSDVPGQPLPMETLLRGFVANATREYGVIGNASELAAFYAAHVGAKPPKVNFSTHSVLVVVDQEGGGRCDLRVVDVVKGDLAPRVRVRDAAGTAIVCGERAGAHLVSVPRLEGRILFLDEKTLLLEEQVVVETQNEG